MYFSWLYLFCVMTEGCLKLYSECCLWNRSYLTFTFYISCLDCDINIFSPWRFWDVNPPCFSTWMFHVAYEPVLLVAVDASISIFLLCIKCVYVHRSHGNAFSCNMCCLFLLPCFSYVVVMFFMSDFKGLNIFSKLCSLCSYSLILFTKILWYPICPRLIHCCKPYTQVRLSDI